MPDPAIARPKPPPKQARSAAKRAAILDTAEQLIEQHSPASLTTRQVAEAANVPIGSIYRYFANMDDLLRSLFERLNAGTVQALQASLEDAAPDWRTDLDRTFDHLARLHRTHPAYGPLLAYLDPEEDDDISDLLGRLIARGAPHLAPDLAQHVTRTVLAMIDGVERRLYRLPDSDRDAALDQARIAVSAYLSHHLQGSTG